MCLTQNKALYEYKSQFTSSVIILRFTFIIFTAADMSVTREKISLMMSVWRLQHVSDHKGTQLPSKYEALAQCWADVVPSSTTLAQPQPNIGPTPRVCWEEYC